MRTFLQLIAWTICIGSGFAQGTFVYDQESADEDHYLDGGTGLGQQPLGQSFTPSLDTVGFIRIYLTGGGGAANFAINLRSDSITGTILASTTPIFLTTGGPSDFFFPTPVSVTPGTTYYFQPVLVSGTGSWGTFLAGYNYSGGIAFVDGLTVPAKDLWFREGIVVPEPNSAALLLLGGGALLCTRRHLRPLQ